MTTLGELLRVNRTEKKISLDALVDVTKVNKKVLESFEQDRIDPDLPPVYVRGFILAYCRYVGIDEQEALGIYEESRKVSESTSVVDNKKINEQVDAPRRTVPLVLMVLVVAALLGYVGFLTFGTDTNQTVSPPPLVEESLPSTTLSDEPLSPSPSPAEPEPEPTPVETPDSAPVPPEESVTAELEPPSQSPAEQLVTVEEEIVEIDKPDVSVTPSVQVRLVATAESWIQAAIDNDPPNDKIYPPGDTVTWEGTEKIELRLGNAGGVELAVNGIPMKPFGKLNQVIRLTFKDNTVSINRGQPQNLERWSAAE